MISIDEARALIFERVRVNVPVRRPVEDAVSFVLAADITSDIDSPPHDKSLVDGYAVVAADISHSGVTLDIIEEITAGQVPRNAVRPGTASRIMTGAPVPAGADAIVMVEKTHRQAGPPLSRVCIEVACVQLGAHIMRRGEAIRRGAAVLPAGHVVRPIDIGLLCEVGHTTVDIVGPPRVAVLATGNELVPPNQVPAAGQIRNSNGPMLSAMARSLGAEVSHLGICPDATDALQQSIARGLDADVLILSGGVSAGVLDLVPHVLGDMGVEQVFHKVFLKPGKPMWFGMRNADSRRTLVFGLPGNPVGSLVCFELFVGPALRQMMGQCHVVREPQQARLSGDHHHRSDRPTYCPAYVERLDGGELVVTLLLWQGSADQRAIGGANCLAFFPPGERRFAMGESLDVHFFHQSEVPNV